MNDELFDEKIAVLNHDAGCSLFYSGGCTCDLQARRAKVEAKIEKHDATFTLTDEQYAEVLATVKRRDVGVLAGYLHVSRWCDGSTACAVTSEPHGHWRGAYSVRSADVIVRLLDENERLTRLVEDYDRRFAMLSKIAQGIDEKVGRYLEFHGPSCDEHEDEPDEFCATCRMDTAANDAISELKFWSKP
jgi:hypothetical protein